MSENNFRFSEMLRINKPFEPSDDDLNTLAKFMAPREHHLIPAGYTYLGQFIDHDVSLDSIAAVQRPTFPAKRIPLETVFNLRTPFLNLETIYSFEKPANPGEPAREELLKTGSKTLLRLGDTFATGTETARPEKDLPRKHDSVEAVIVDKRNDSILPVAQTQVAFMRFHNAVVKYLGDDNSTPKFEEARKTVIQHYQWIILHDYLPKIIDPAVLNDVLKNGTKFYISPDPQKPFVPLEYSVGAFRMGHSMIRDSYNWNRRFNRDPANKASPATLSELSEFTGRGRMRGFPMLPTKWLINWHWFYEDTSLNNQFQKLNRIRGINTTVARELGFLPGIGGTPTGFFDRETSLPAWDLYRARALGLPTGQEVATRILGSVNRVLPPERIAELLPAKLQIEFSRKTPLWFYLLAEAEIEGRSERLGEVGSRILAETFVKLIELTDPSIMPDFTPNRDFCNSAREFGMPQMLRFIAAQEGSIDGFDPLNPLETG